MHTFAKLESVAPEAESVELVPPDDVMSVWPKITGYLEVSNAYGHSKHDMKHWLIMVLSGRADLWVARDRTAVILAETQQYPNERVYLVTLVGGEPGQDWLKHFSAIEARARALKCDVIETWGRLGWKRMGERAGFKITAVLFARELKNPHQEALDAMEREFNAVYGVKRG